MFVARIIMLSVLGAMPMSVYAANDAALLGPGVTNAQTGASPDTSATLQPNGPSALQPTGSTPTSSASDQAVFQQPASDQAKLLVQGDADTSPSGSSTGGGVAALYSIGIVATLIVVTAIVWLLAKYDLEQPIITRHSSPAASRKPKKRRKKLRKTAKS